MRNILAFETSLGNCSVALYKDGEMDFSESKQRMMQSEELIPMVNEILSKNDVSYKDLSAISCSVGPGSFTGIRVGVAAALGMKKTLPETKLIGISTLDAITHEAPKELLETNGKLLTILRSYGEEFFAQEFSDTKKSKSEIQVITQENLKKSREKYAHIFSNEDLDFVTKINFNAKTLLNISLNRYDISSSKALIEPIYVKKPNIHGHN